MSHQLFQHKDGDVLSEPHLLRCRTPLAPFVAILLLCALFPSALLPCSPHGSHGGATSAFSLPQHTHPSVLLLHHSAGFQVQVPSPLLFAAALPFEDFTPFGPGAGDSQLAHADDTTSVEGVEMPGLRVLGARSDYAYPDINGLIAFQSKGGFSYTARPPPFRSSFGPAIAAMWTDIDTRNRAIGTTPGFPEENNVFYRRENSTNATAIYNVLADRFTELGAEFTPDAALIVTWWKVGSYSQDNSVATSAQAVLLHNDKQTFIVLRLNGPAPRNPVGVGIDAGRQLDDPNYCQMTAENITFDSTVCDAALFPNYAASSGYVDLQHLKQTQTSRPGEFIFSLTRPPTVTVTPPNTTTPTFSKTGVPTPTATPAKSRSQTPSKTSGLTATKTAAITQTRSPVTTVSPTRTQVVSLTSTPSRSSTVSRPPTPSDTWVMTSTAAPTPSVVHSPTRTAIGTSTMTARGTLTMDLTQTVGETTTPEKTATAGKSPTMTSSFTRTVKDEPVSGLGRRSGQLTPTEVAGISTGASLLFLLLLAAFVVAFIIFIVYRRRKDKNEEKDVVLSDTDASTVDMQEDAPPVVVIGDDTAGDAGVPVEIVTGTALAPTEPLYMDAPVDLTASAVPPAPASAPASPPEPVAVAKRKKWIRDTRRRGGLPTKASAAVGKPAS